MATTFPLRPVPNGAGDLISSSFAVLWRRIGLFIALAALPAIVILIPTIASIVATLSLARSISVSGDPTQIAGQFIVAMGIVVLGLLIGIVVSVYIQALMMRVPGRSPRVRRRHSPPSPPGAGTLSPGCSA